MTDGGSDCRDPSRVSNRRMFSGYGLHLADALAELSIDGIAALLRQQLEHAALHVRGALTVDELGEVAEGALGAIHVGLFPRHARAGADGDPGAEIDGQQQFRAGRRGAARERVDQAAVAGVDRQAGKSRAFGELEVDAGDSRVFQDGKARQVRRVLGRGPVQRPETRPSPSCSNLSGRNR